MQHEIISHWSLENTHNALVVEEQQKKKLRHKVAHSGALLHVQHMKMFFYECFFRLSFVSCRSPQTPSEKEFNVLSTYCQKETLTKQRSFAVTKLRHSFLHAGLPPCGFVTRKKS